MKFIFCFSFCKPLFSRLTGIRLTDQPLSGSRAKKQLTSPPFSETVADEISKPDDFRSTHPNDNKQCSQKHKTDIHLYLICRHVFKYSIRLIENQAISCKQYSIVLKQCAIVVKQYGGSRKQNTIVSNQYGIVSKRDRVVYSFRAQSQPFRPVFLPAVTHSKSLVDRAFQWLWVPGLSCRGLSNCRGQYSPLTTTYFRYPKASFFYFILTLIPYKNDNE